MKRTFETARLRVFSAPFAPGEMAKHYTAPRLLFVAFRMDEDRPMVCATALVTPKCPYEPKAAYLDWIEVASEYRREGFGRELYDGIVKCLRRPLLADGGTEVGVLFCDSLREASRA